MPSSFSTCSRGRQGLRPCAFCGLAGRDASAMTRLTRRAENMKLEKRKRLEQAGWKVGSTQEFLGLSDEEMAVIELKLVLRDQFRERRRRLRLSQQAVA